MNYYDYESSSAVVYVRMEACNKTSKEKLLLKFMQMYCHIFKIKNHTIHRLVVVLLLR